jgi:phosphomannomutase
MKIMGKNIMKGISILVIYSFLITNTLYASSGHLRIPMNPGKLGETLKNKQRKELMTRVTSLSRVKGGIVAGFGVKDNAGRLLIPDGRFFESDGNYSKSLQRYVDQLSDSDMRKQILAGMMYYDIRSAHWKQNPEYTVAFALAYAKKLQEKTGRKDGIIVNIGLDCYQKHFEAAGIFVDTLLRTGICDNGGGINYWGTINGGDIRNYSQLYHAQNGGEGGNWIYFTMSHVTNDFWGSKLGMDAKVYCGSDVRPCEGVTSGTLYHYIVEKNFADIKHDKPVGNILTVSNFTKNNIKVAADMIRATSSVSDKIPDSELLKGARLYVDMAGSLVGRNLVNIDLALGADVQVINEKINPDFKVENIIDPNELSSGTKQLEKNRALKQIARETGRTGEVVDPDADRGSKIAVDSEGNPVAMTGSELLLLAIEDLAKSYKDKGFPPPTIICDMRTGLSSKDLKDALNKRGIPVKVVPHEAGYPFFMRGMAKLPADIAVENTTHAFTNPMTNKNWGAPVEYRGYQGGDNAALFLTYLSGAMVHKWQGRNPVQQLEWIRKEYNLRPTKVDERKPALPLEQDEFKYMIADRMKLLAKEWFTDAGKFWVNFNDPQVELVSGVHITNIKTGAMMLVRFSNTGSTFTISGEGYIGKNNSRKELDEMLSLGRLLLVTATEQLRSEGNTIDLNEQDAADLKGVFNPGRYGLKQIPIIADIDSKLTLSGDAREQI